MQKLIALTLAMGLALAAPVELKVSLKVGDKPMFYHEVYQTPQGQKYQIDLLKFFISDVALVKADGSEVKIPGLVLANFEKGTPPQDITVMKFDAPAGKYVGIRFDVGVPREQNYLDASLQKAPLGVESGMYWAWNPGYIFYRLEGRALLDSGEKKWVVHMGFENFRLPVRLHDLQSNKIQIEVPEAGGAIRLDLNIAAAFQPGPGGVFLDWSKPDLLQMHGMSPQTRPIMSVINFNMTNAFSLSK